MLAGQARIQCWLVLGLPGVRGGCPTTGWEQMPPTEELVGCGAAPGAPGSAGTALRKMACPLERQHLPAEPLAWPCGFLVFSVYFPLNEKIPPFFLTFFQSQTSRSGRMANPALMPTVAMRGQEMPKVRLAWSYYTYTPHRALSAAPWPCIGSNLCG